MSNITTSEEATHPLLAEIRRLDEQLEATFEAVNRLNAEEERKVDTRVLSSLLTALAHVRDAEKEQLTGVEPGHKPRFTRT
jgi:hypothetical protein